MFVRFVLVWFYRCPLPLSVWKGLRFVIVALPGLFLTFFCVTVFYNYFLDILIGCAIKVNSCDWAAFILSRKLPENCETIVPLSIKTEELRKCFHTQSCENVFIKLQFLVKDRDFICFWLDCDQYKAETFFLLLWLDCDNHTNIC